VPSCPASEGSSSLATAMPYEERNTGSPQRHGLAGPFAGELVHRGYSIRLMKQSKSFNAPKVLPVIQLPAVADQLCSASGTVAPAAARAP
jgi:hypothetical protein